MGIKFTCPHCKGVLNVKSNLAGKRGRCPKCDGKIDIPAEGGEADAAAAAVSVAPASVSPRSSGAPAPLVAADTRRPLATTGPQVAAVTAVPAAAAAAPQLHEETSALAGPTGQAPVGHAPAGQAAGPDAISEAPQMQWYVMPPGASSQYGPAAGDAFRGWIKEGRVAADSLVWRQDWPEWKRAGSVFPELDPRGGRVLNMPGFAAGFAIPTAMGALPTAAGVLPQAGAVPFAGMAGGPVVAGFPVAGPLGFPLVPAESTASAARRTQYRPRSNTGPVVAIVVLVVLMIPLSYFVWKVISDQWSAPPPAPPAGAEGAEK